MKKLVVGGLIVVGIVLYICIVWFSRPALAPTEDTASTNVATSSNYQITNATTTPAGTTEATAPAARLETDTTVNSAEESVFIDTTTLTDGQRTLLRTFGVEGDTIEITPAMLACAEAELGSERVAEIGAGATPSFMEGLSLVRCF